MNDTFYKKLANGVRIVLRRRSSAVTYVGVMVGSGTRDEQQDESGLAHYIEHCVFKGCRSVVGQTKELTAKDIIDKVEGVGGEINAYTTKEETTFYAATQKSHWRKTLTLIADMIQHPTFPKDETDKEVGVILDEIDSYEDSPSELIYDDFENLIFQGHHLANPILGTKKSVRAISKQKSTALAFMARQYRPERMVVFVQGDLASEQVFRAVENIFGGLTSPTGNTGTTVRQAPDVIQPQTTVYKKHTHQVHVMLGGRAYPIGHEKQLALYLLNNILGGGSMSSRLNMQLREKRGLVYTIESQYTPLSDSGYWSVYFASDAKDKDTCIRVIKKQLQRLCAKPLSPRQLKQALQQLHGQMAISSENQENNVLAMGKLMLYHNCAPSWEDTFQKIATLTPEQLVNVAREIYCESNISVLSYE